MERTETEITGSNTAATLARTPVLLYDGNCGFCRVWIDYWKELTGGAVQYVAMQDAPEPLAGIVRRHGMGAVLLAEPGGNVLAGAHAVFSALATVPGRRWPLAAYERIPGFAAVTETAYTIIARHRNAPFKATRLLWGLPLQRPTYALTLEIFLRLLGAIYLIAFVSFGVQAAGLIGSNGILPVSQIMTGVHDYYGALGYWVFPTVLWLNSSDAAIACVWMAGAIISVLLIAGIAKRPACAALFVLYLSLVSAGQVFMGFQWDGLLLETGFLAILLARPGLAVWLLRFLLFRLMFMSGAVKLLSGDPSWHNLTALRYHYQTQPLPTPFAWYAHQLPASVQEASTAVMFFVELVVPFFIFFPRRIRFAAAMILISFQLVIFLTGNYTFFNLLAILLCLLLLDDTRIAPLFPVSFAERVQARARSAKSGRIRNKVIAAVAVYLVIAGMTDLTGRLFGFVPAPVNALLRYIAPLSIVNNYGLFAVMTTTRPEIVIEGSEDGDHWQEYGFKWKPGDLKRPPRWVQPHQPRLDWQMWFAALGDYRENPWTVRLLYRLLQGSPEVLRLLAHNPFPNAPPRYVRALRYEYRFTTPAERKQTGNWWHRELLGPYLPSLTLADMMKAGVQ